LQANNLCVLNNLWLIIFIKIIKGGARNDQNLDPRSSSGYVAEYIYILDMRVITYSKLLPISSLWGLRFACFR